MTDDLPISRRTAALARLRSVADGVMTRIREHRTGSLIIAAAVTFALIGTGAVFAGVAVGSASAAAVGPSASAAPPRSLPAGEQTATRLRTCSVAPLAADPRLMALTGSVMRADTGEVLYDRGASTAARPASVLKVLTASAAISVLGPTYQIATRVVDGSAPGTVVLVGRGDATLSAMPSGTESVYVGAPKLSSLAGQVLISWKSAHPGVPITNIVLDTSYWNPADKWDAGWKRSEQTTGYHSEVTALQVDGDRADPTKATSPRSTDPVSHAGAAFLTALRDTDTEGIVADDVTFSTGTATSNTKLGEVLSQPVSVLLGQMLSNSDNTLAEMLARIVSKESGMDGSAASLQKAIPSALVGLDPSLNFASKVTIVDGSGLSAANAVPPLVMTTMMRAVHAGSFGLAPVRDALPVAGKSGSLADRFTGANAVVRGNVTAKTGWIDTGYTLSGFLTAADGTVLIFTLYAIGEGITADAKDALDTLTTGIYSCGDNLSSN